MAGANEWVEEFRALHQAARKGGLPAADMKLYMEAREQLARMLITAQGMSQPPGQTARQTFRALDICRAPAADS